MFFVDQRLPSFIVHALALLAVCFVPLLIYYMLGYVSSDFLKSLSTPIGFERTVSNWIYMWLTLIFISRLMAHGQSILSIAGLALMFYLFLRLPDYVELFGLSARYFKWSYVFPYSLFHYLYPLIVFVLGLIVSYRLRNRHLNLWPLREWWRPALVASVAPIATFAAIAFLFSLANPFLLLWPMAAIYSYGKFILVFLVGLWIGAYARAGSWTAAFATLVGLVAPIPKLPLLWAYPEGKLIVGSYVWVALLFLAWFVAFKVWVNPNSRVGSVS